ncbi:MAG: pyridoxal phosphate-dependent aminotransferase [Planctomycetes bacterium]|nr:pyridoxal phosphate-dependent aminotransferase [Planctomycetota bacterium]
MFSDRLPPPELTNPLSRLLSDRRAAGAELLDLTESNPTRAGFRYESETILQSLSAPASLIYEPAPQGLESARKAVADYYAARGLAVDPAHILLTASTSEAYGFAFKALCRPGEAVAVPAPSYPLFEFLAAAEGIQAVPYPLSLAGGTWHLEIDALADSITPATRAILVVSPNNPTGSYLKRHELEALRRLAGPREIALVADEVFADYAAGPDPARAPSLAAESAGLALALNGLSKICGLPQMKLGWMVASGEPGLCTTAIARLAAVSDTYLSVGAPVQHAARALLDTAPAIQEQIRARCAANEAVLRTSFAGIPHTRVLPREGGWYAVVEAPDAKTDEEWAMMWLREDGVYVHPGYLFGFRAEGCLVMSLLTPPERFSEGVRRIAEAIRAVAG